MHKIVREDNKGSFICMSLNEKDFYKEIFAQRPITTGTSQEEQQRNKKMQIRQEVQSGNDSIDTGKLQVQVRSSLGLIPVENAKIEIFEKTNPDKVIEELRTDGIGHSEIITLPAPPLEYSQTPDQNQPYKDYNIRISAEGYEQVYISGSEILPGETSIQPVDMIPLEIAKNTEEDIVIPEHTLFGDYPAKIPEAEVKPVDESGEIVLSRVVIPEYVVVHDGAPSDRNATNYYVRYTDYIKNVVSSEIYSTWSEDTIYANTFAIMSFTLNRVYTEWYRGKGYDFTITSSTAYDQKWIYGRNIYSNISRIVDSVFNNYVSRPGIKQPLFTSYCNGTTATCTGLSQWGSKYLGDEGYTPIEILRFYYGNNIYLNQSEYISGVPYSWPGTDLRRGSTGTKVRQLQEQLNRIAQNYPLIPVLRVDGIYGPATENSVRVFQGVFNLPQTGVVDYATWYKVSQIYVGVSRISEPGT